MSKQLRYFSQLRKTFLLMLFSWPPPTPLLWGKTQNSDLHTSSHVLFPLPLKFALIWLFLLPSSTETALGRSPVASSLLNQIVPSPSLDPSATFDTADGPLFPNGLCSLGFRTPHTLRTNLGYVNYPSEPECLIFSPVWATCSFPAQVIELYSSVQSLCSLPWLVLLTSHLIQR